MVHLHARPHRPNGLNKWNMVCVRFPLKACTAANTGLKLFSWSMIGKEATNSSHGGGSDHFPPGFLGLPDLIVFVIKILKYIEDG